MEVISLRIVGAVVATLLFTGFVVMLVLSVTLGGPNSTQGVSRTGENIARVPRGETIVITYNPGKNPETWRLTYNDNQIVTDCSGLCVNPEPATLCGVGCEVAIDAGVVSKFKVRQIEGNAVSVEWPNNWPWSYQPYTS